MIYLSRNLPLRVNKREISRPAWIIAKMADLTKTLRLAHSIIFFASGWKFARTQPFKALKQVLSPKLGICLNFPNGWLLPAIFRDLLWSLNVSLASFSFSWIRGLYMWTYWKSLRDFLFIFLLVLMSVLLSSTSSFKM